MKSVYNLSVLLLNLLLFSCSSDDDSSGIIGQWKLSQILADPGDGSGVFTDIDSDKTITFFEDGTFSSNGNICFFEPFNDRDTNGTYSLQDQELIPINCDSFAQIIWDIKLERNGLIIYYLCIEACAEKYEKIN